MSQGDENSKNRGAKEVAKCVSQLIPPRTLAPSRDSHGLSRIAFLLVDPGTAKRRKNLNIDFDVSLGVRNRQKIS
jgi:hypothetical protein